VLVVGGGSVTGNLPGLVLASAELYEPGKGSWTAAGGLIDGRLQHTATLLLDGKVLVAGGSRGAGYGYPLASAELYDSASGS
jgi:hypothetical protein